LPPTGGRETLGVHLAQVVGVRLGVRRERTDDGRLVGVDIGERRDRRAAARGARTAPDGTHGADATSGAGQPGSGTLVDYPRPCELAGAVIIRGILPAPQPRPAR